MVRRLFTINRFGDGRARVRLDTRREFRTVGGDTGARPRGRSVVTETPLSRPLVAVIADVQRIGKHPFHVAGEKYLAAVHEAADALPLILPALAIDADEVLDAVDGVLMTGAPSNVAPERYGGAMARPGTLDDPARDAAALPLIRAALARGVPLLAICRGFQELNVALGGTLFQHLQEQPGRIDHRERDDDPLEVQYGPAHEVRLAPEGYLATLFDATGITVNSLHGQGIDRLAPGLEVEGRAPDGTIEAVRVAAAPGFAIGVQWHPEWRPSATPHHLRLLGAFGAAARHYRETRS